MQQSMNRKLQESRKQYAKNTGQTLQQVAYNNQQQKEKQIKKKHINEFNKLKNGLNPLYHKETQKKIEQSMSNELKESKSQYTKNSETTRLNKLKRTGRAITAAPGNALRSTGRTISKKASNTKRAISRKAKATGRAIKAAPGRAMRATGRAIKAAPGKAWRSSKKAASNGAKRLKYTLLSKEGRKERSKARAESLSKAFSAIRGPKKPKKSVDERKEDALKKQKNFIYTIMKIGFVVLIIGGIAFWPWAIIIYFTFTRLVAGYKYMAEPY